MSDFLAYEIIKQLHELYEGARDLCVSIGTPLENFADAKPLIQSMSGFFYSPFHMEKDFKIAAQYVAVWIFFGFCAVLVLQAWGFLPLTKF